MNKMINLQKASRTKLFFGGVTMVMFVFSFLWTQNAFAIITTQLDFGDRGSEVSELQTFLAGNASFYPSGLVTGYFGPLTQDGVERYQVARGIVSSGTPSSTGYGRVGPTTKASINYDLGNLSGGPVSPSPIGGADRNSPSIYSLNVSTSNTGATLNWNTTENSSAIIYYGVSPISLTEANASMGVTVSSNSNLLVHTDLRTSHSAVLTGLQSDTTYNYVVYVRDGSGNESITWPSTFRTN